MSRSWSRNRVWAIVLCAMCFIVNMPQDAGTLKPWIWDAGFPMTYAHWNGERLVEWHSGKLVLNILVWLIVFAAIAAGNGLARRSKLNA